MYRDCQMLVRFADFLFKRRDLDSDWLSFQRIIDLPKLATYGNFFDDQN